MTTTNTLATLTDALHACQVAITQLAPSVAQTNALAHVQDALRLAEQLQTQPRYEPITDASMTRTVEAIIDGLDEYAGCRLCRLVQPRQQQENDSHE